MGVPSDPGFRPSWVAQLTSHRRYEGQLREGQDVEQPLFGRVVQVFPSQPPCHRRERLGPVVMKPQRRFWEVRQLLEPQQQVVIGHLWPRTVQRRCSQLLCLPSRWSSVCPGATNHRSTRDPLSGRPSRPGSRLGDVVSRLGRGVLDINRE